MKISLHPICKAVLQQIRTVMVTLVLVTGTAGFAQNFSALGDLIYEDTLSLRPLDPWITINQDPDNPWEAGMPSKQYFSSSHTGRVAIMTDTSGTYAPNLDQYFTITIPRSENWWGEGILSFYHKYDTDTLRDGGIVEFREYLGEPFVNFADVLQNEFSFRAGGLYTDTIRGGEKGFSGRSDGWEYVEIYMFWVGLTKGAGTDMDIRFRFVSDSIDTGKEGWMIDDIVFRGYSVTGSAAPGHVFTTRFYPNPARDMIFFPDWNVMKNPIVRIVDLSGKVIMDRELCDNSLDISGLEKGMYLLRVSEEGSYYGYNRLVIE